MPSKLVQARNIRNNDVILASTADELVTLLALYKGTSAADPYYQIPVTIQLLPIDYTFTAAQLPLPIRSNMSLLGTGAQQTRLISAQTTSVGAKNIIECRDLWSSGGGSAGKCRHVTLGQFTVVGDAYAPAGIYARGLNNSIIHDVMLKNLTASGSIGIQLDAEDTFGCYYNHLHSIDIGYSGSDGAGIGIRIKTTDLATQPKRANSNTLTMCSVKYCVDAAYELNGCVATTFTGCEAEINAVGFRVLSSINTVISGGYCENNSSSDIQLGSLSGPPESSSQTVIMQPLLASTTRLAGQSRGSTGDLYVIANDSTAPSATKYDGTWSDKSYVGALSAGYAYFSAYSSATRVGYYKLSGDSNYRLEVQNDGKLKWGGGSAATDIEMFWEAANVLSLGNNDTFRLNGGSGWIQWASASGATADISMYRWGADVLTLFNGDSFQIASTGKLLFTSTTVGSPDAAFARSSAGVLEINNGTLGTYRDLLVRNLTSSGAITASGNITMTGGNIINDQSVATHGFGHYRSVGNVFYARSSVGYMCSMNSSSTIGFVVKEGYPIGWSAWAGGLDSTPHTSFFNSSTGVVQFRSSSSPTTAQTFEVFNTYTSATNGEFIRLRGVAGANFEFGPSNGSAGGTLRGLTIGGYANGSSTITPWLSFDSAGAATFSGANLGLNGAVSAGGGVGIVFIANATTAPTTNPTGGGILYVESGALKYRGSSGTVTTLGPA